MGLNAHDIEYITKKRRIYLIVFICMIVSNVAAYIYNSGFYILSLLLAIAFLTQFLPALKRAEYSTGLLILFAIVFFIPFPCIAIVMLAVLDNNLYQTIRGARGVR